MSELNIVGKILILVGVVLVILGLTFLLGGKIPWLGKLPGDIYIQKKNSSFYFPITTCILISIIMTMVLWLWKKR
ncbi:MAG: DUF2905 domain-containing protein [Candidatus Omnitrophota bacterium]